VAFLEITAAGLVLACLLFVMSSRLRPSLASPVYGLIGYYLAICIFGYYIYGLGRAYKDIFYDINISAKESLNTVPIILFQLICFALGVLFRLYLMGLDNRLPRMRSNIPLATRTPIAGSRKVRLGYALPFLAIAPIIILVLGVGVDNLLSRSDYLTYDYQALKTVGSALSLAAIPFLGYLTFSPRKKPFIAIACVTFFILYEFVFFAMASRRGVLGPILFSLGAVLASPSSWKARGLVLISLAAAPWLMELPLAFRGLAKQGAIPFVGALFDSNSSNLFDFVDSYQTFFLNVFFSLPLAAYVRTHASVVSGTLSASLNPLPGALLHWDALQDKLRVNPFVPFNAIGESMAHGLAFSAVFFILVGVFFCSNELYIKRQLKKGSLIQALPVLGLLYIFILISSQYQLRTSVRIIYYIIAIRLALSVFDLFKNALGSKKYVRSKLGADS